MAKEVELVLPSPNAKQKLMFKDEHRYVAYGGARGGGKSWAVRVNALLLAARHPGIDQVIIRRSYPELYANHIKPFLQLLPREMYKYNDSKKELKLSNGSIINFKYCANEKDLLNFQGTQCDVMYIDEATQITEDMFRALDACVRGVNKFPRRTYLTCNPGGIGHQWVKRLFIDRHFKDGEKPEQYSFIQAKVQDNKKLLKEQPDYIEQLMAQPAKRREAWLEGNWDIYEGQAFDDFCIEPDVQTARAAGCELSVEELRAQGRWCHVIEPFDMSSGERKGWTIFRSYDFGYNKPFSCAWWAVDYDGVLYRIMEMYGWNGTANEGARWSTDQQFQAIAKQEREHPWLKGKQIHGVADPAIWARNGGESTAEVAARYGIHFSKGDNERIPGWMQCHYRLQFDANGYPRMYVFSNCEAFIRTIPLMQYDHIRVEDIDTKLEDHVADEWRYACMSRPVTPMRPVKERTIVNDPLNQFQKRR